jgi:transposase
MDAAMLARFAQERIDTIKPYQLPSETQQEMTALATRIVQVQKDMVADKARLATAHKSIKNSLESSIAHFEREVDKLKARLIALLKRCPEMAAKAVLLDSVPGVGIHTAAMLLATLPELGTLNRQQIAKLAGLAPIQDQSGNRDGKARIAGGRSLVRKVLFMATLTADRHEPVIAAFYNRILERKSEFKIAHVAAMRKLITILNAIIKTGKPWEDRSAKSP